MPDDGPAIRADDLAHAVAVGEGWRRRGLRTVLTNGCFDVLHVGHVRYLDAAARLGDVLVVAVNDDASTGRLKGPRRPVVPLAERLELLGALRSVRLVLPFGQDTAEAVVRALRPQVYVKGGDYDDSLRTPPEASVARAVGAEVVYLPFVEGRSTTDLIQTIARRWR